jgi:hypothetical protein
MQLVDRAILAPGCCAICQNTKGQMWDTGVATRLGEIAGRLYICRAFCIPKICEGSGSLNPAASRAMREALEMAEAERDELKAKVDRMAPVVRAVARARELDEVAV